MLEEFSALTIHKAKELHELFMQILNSAQDDIVLDFSTIQKIDMVAIQLLLSLQKSCTKKNKQLRLINIQDSIKKEFQLSGCYEEFLYE